MDNTEFITFFIFITLSLAIGWIATSGVKSQFIRIIDVVLYGPFLIYIGMISSNILVRYILMFIGAATISYNLRNYIYERG